MAVRTHTPSHPPEEGPASEPTPSLPEVRLPPGPGASPEGPGAGAAGEAAAPAAPPAGPDAEGPPPAASSRGVGGASVRASDLTSVDGPRASVDGPRASVDGPGGGGPSVGRAELARLLAAAEAAPAGAGRQEAAGRLVAALGAGVPEGEDRRAVADLLVGALAAGRLEVLVDGEGRTARGAAAEALLGLGYPWALEIAPEDLAHLRQEQARREGAGAPGGRAAATLALGAVGGAALLAGAGVEGQDLAWVVAQGFLGAVSVGAYTQGDAAPEQRRRQGRLFAVLAAGVGLVGALFDPSMLLTLGGPAAAVLLLHRRP